MRKVTLLLIDIYKILISPALESMFGRGCKFYPTCSQYTKEAVEEFGVIKGLTMGTKRVIRCNPLNHPNSYYDPVIKIN